MHRLLGLCVFNPGSGLETGAELHKAHLLSPCAIYVQAYCPVLALIEIPLHAATTQHNTHCLNPALSL